MKTRYALPFSLLFLAAMPGCKDSREQMLTRKWQEVSIENEQMEQVIRDQKALTDTMGKGSSPEANEILYGTRNVDSLRASLDAEIEAYHTFQQTIINQTWFHFRDDSVLVVHSDEGLDSAKWYFEDDKTIVMDEMAMKGAGTKIRMQVMALSDTNLTLRFSQDQSASVINFRPAKQ